MKRLVGRLQYPTSKKSLPYTSVCTFYNVHPTPTHTPRPKLSWVCVSEDGPDRFDWLQLAITPLKLLPFGKYALNTELYIFSLLHLPGESVTR